MTGISYDLHALALLAFGLRPASTVPRRVPPQPWRGTVHGGCGQGRTTANGQPPSTPQSHKEDL